MPDFLDTLAQDAKKTVNKGYYTVSTQATFSPVSLKKAVVENRRNAVITEVKAASPSRGTIRESFDPKAVAAAMKNGGATGISVLTEPKHFNGSLSILAQVRETVELPILMKDIFVSPAQLEAASRSGANAVLLIQALFERGYCELRLDEMISEAHARNLEVLLETHNESEFCSAVETDADLVGINNRDLKSLKVDIGVTERILKKCDSHGRVVVSESGVMSISDLVFLRGCGAQAFLIGSAIMMAGHIEKRVKEFVTAP